MRALTIPQRRALAVGIPRARRMRGLRRLGFVTRDGQVTDLNTVNLLNRGVIGPVPNYGGPAQITVALPNVSPGPISNEPQVPVIQNWMPPVSAPGPCDPSNPQYSANLMAGNCGDVAPFPYNANPAQITVVTNPPASWQQVEAPGTPIVPLNPMATPPNVVAPSTVAPGPTTSLPLPAGAVTNPTYQIDPVTGYPIDPTTGLPFDPLTGLLISSSSSFLTTLEGFFTNSPYYGWWVLGGIIFLPKLLKKL